MGANSAPTASLPVVLGCGENSGLIKCAECADDFDKRSLFALRDCTDPEKAVSTPAVLEWPDPSVLHTAGKMEAGYGKGHHGEATRPGGAK